MTNIGEWKLRMPWLKGRSGQASAGTEERAGGPDGESPYVTVYLAASLPEGYVIKGKLETEDIPVLLRYESGGTVFGLVGGELGSVEVQVPRPLEERARKLLEEDEEVK